MPKAAIVYYAKELPNLLGQMLLGIEAYDTNQLNFHRKEVLQFVLSLLGIQKDKVWFNIRYDILPFIGKLKNERT